VSAGNFLTLFVGLNFSHSPGLLCIIVYKSFGHMFSAYFIDPFIRDWKFKILFFCSSGVASSHVLVYLNILAILAYGSLLNNIEVQSLHLVIVIMCCQLCFLRCSMRSMPETRWAECLNILRLLQEPPLCGHRGDNSCTLGNEKTLLYFFCSTAGEIYVTLVSLFSCVSRLLSPSFLASSLQ
jgi:hypothetical protein